MTKRLLEFDRRVAERVQRVADDRRAAAVDVLAAHDVSRGERAERFQAPSLGSICRQLRQGLLPETRLNLCNDEGVGPLAPVVPLMMVDGAYWLTRAARRAVSAIVSARRAMNSDATAPTS